jgi:hypothetical protein
MTAVVLFDTLSRSSSATTAQTQASLSQLARFAEELVEAALLDWERIQHYQSEFASSEWNAQSLEIERSLHEMLRNWSTEAEEVRTRARQLVATGAEIPQLKSLEKTLGHARAELQLTPEQVARAMEDVRQGKIVPIKELRDELRARHRS